MPALAFALSLVFFGMTFGVQALDQRRRTGETGWVDPGRKNRTERVADALFVTALALVLVAPGLAATGLVEPLAALDRPLLHVLGAVAIVAATVGARLAQRTMGSAWRTGVADGASGPLVQDGAFAHVRNPVYTAIVVAAAGSALLVPSAVALAGVIVFVLALEIQTRRVEEPHLAAEHGERYEAYTARAGRFVPWLGRLGRRSAQRSA